MKIYIRLENLYIFENSELKKSYAYFSDEATVSDINLPYAPHYCRMKPWQMINLF